MRIIDKKHDFYDYLSNADDTLVFDRRDSYIVTKADVCHCFDFVSRRAESKYRFLLFQCGAVYWLILLTITNNDWYHGNYNLEVLMTWKNYNRKRELIKLDLISFTSYFLMTGGEFDHDKIISNASKIKNMIDTDDYRSDRVICSCIHNRYNYKKREYETTFAPPILAATGIGNVVDPMQVFLAVEEYFSLSKTESERTDPVGVTNNDKIVMHGFDTKTSFRGKQ